MNQTRVIGMLVALLGVAIIAYELSDLLMLLFRSQGAGVGTVSITSVLLGVVLFLAGLCAAIFGGGKRANK